MSDRNDDEKVGYGRPPRQHRFKPGQSGNPKGRPKRGPKRLSVPEMLSKPVVLNGKKHPYYEVYFEVLKKRAIDGNRQAEKFILELIKQGGLIKLDQASNQFDWFEDAQTRLEAKLRALSKQQSETDESLVTHGSDESKQADDE
jgi:hypothetical protein